MELSSYLSENNISYQKFARQLGLKSTSAALNVYRWAKGKRNPRPDTAKKISKITNGKVTIADLYRPLESRQ